MNWIQKSNIIASAQCNVFQFHSICLMLFQNLYYISICILCKWASVMIKNNSLNLTQGNFKVKTMKTLSRRLKRFSVQSDSQLRSPLFSLLEPKAEVSNRDCNLTVVRCPSCVVRPPSCVVHKLFTFSSSFLKLMSGF